jgi:hypothetical protein
MEAQVGLEGRPSLSLWRQIAQAFWPSAVPARPSWKRHGRHHHAGGGAQQHRHRPTPSPVKKHGNRVGKLFNKLTLPKLQRGKVIAYHGTPSPANARSIVKDGFMVGAGNGLGDGVYFADLATAKTYAGSTGVILKCAIKVGRTCYWGPPMQAKYAAWCIARGVVQNNSAITAYLRQNGFETIQNNGVVVVLAPQFANPSAWKRKFHQVKILGVHNPNGKRIYV